MSTRVCSRCYVVEDKRSLVRLRFRQDSGTISWRACAVCATEVCKDIEAQAKEIAKLAKQIAVVEGEELKIAEDRALRSLRLNYENVRKARTKYDAAQKCAADWEERFLSSMDGGDLDPRSPEEERLTPTLKKESGPVGADADKVGSIFKKGSPEGADVKKVGSPVGISAPVPASLREEARGVLPLREEESASRPTAVEISTIVLSSSSDSEEPDGRDSDYDLDSNVCGSKRRKGDVVDKYSLGASSKSSLTSGIRVLRNGKKILTYASDEEDEAQECPTALAIRWTAAEEESLRQEMEKYADIDGARPGDKLWKKIADCDKFGGRSNQALKSKWDRMESSQRKRVG